MDLKDIMLSERGQYQQVTYCMTFFDKTHKDKEQISGYQALRVERSDWKGIAWGVSGHDGAVLYPDYRGGYLNLYVC